MNLDSQELQDLLTALIALSVSLTIFDSNGIFGLFSMQLDELLLTLVLYGFIVGSAFLLHELAHKYVANYYGYPAQFQIFPLGIFIMLVLAILPIGIIFLAPGAVVIYSYSVTKKEEGIISLAGPLTNIFLSIIFYLVAASYIKYLFVSFLSISPIFIERILLIASRINAFLALFNLLPFFILDGVKVIRWNFFAWAVSFLSALFLLFI